MSRKNKNATSVEEVVNETTETPVETEAVNEASTVDETPTEEAPDVVEEATTETEEAIPVETVEEESKVTEVNIEDTTTEPADVSDVVKEMGLAEDKNEAEVEVIEKPDLEVGGKFYVNFGPCNDKKAQKVIDAIEKFGAENRVEADGDILAGPFISEPIATAFRKKIAGLGFKGVVYTFD